MDFRQDEEVVVTFLEETTERLVEIEAGVLQLERTSPAVDGDLVHRIFRAAHSIKAGANLLKLQNIQELAHRLEHVLQQFRTGELTPDDENTTVLLETIDAIQHLVDNLERSDAMDISQQVRRLSPYGTPQ
jgi:two-component system chemotaxis sensor kinase CheA